jgi:hypothetical protein
MKNRLVMVTVQRGSGGPSMYRLAYGKVLPNGKTIIKASLRSDMASKLGIQRGEGIR